MEKEKVKVYQALLQKVLDVKEHEQSDVGFAIDKALHLVTEFRLHPKEVRKILYQNLFDAGFKIVKRDDV